MIEAGLALCLVGTALAVFVPTFVRKVRINKISEASELLQAMSDRASAYYATTWADGKRFCLPQGAGPTPTVPTTDSAAIDFTAEEHGGHETWEALGFQPDRPVRYSYSFLPSRYGCDLAGDGEGSSVAFRAEGDLDGDGVRSVFERRATIDGASLKPAGTLHIHRRVE